MNKIIDSLFATPTKPFRSFSDKKLATDTKGYELAITDNPWFPNTEPSMPVFGEAVDSFNTQLAKASSRDASAIALKNTLRWELVMLCETLVNSVAGMANGSREKLATTTLPMRKAPQPVIVTNPQNFSIINGINPGELDLKIKANRARTNIFEYTEDPPTETSVWTRLTCTTSRCTVSGLQPGKKYWFRVASVGSRGQIAWGETILSPFVQ